MYTCICIHTYIHTYTHTYIHTYTHTHIHTYIHTYIHTNTYICVCLSSLNNDTSKLCST